MCLQIDGTRKNISGDRNQYRFIILHKIFFFQNTRKIKLTDYCYSYQKTTWHRHQSYLSKLFKVQKIHSIPSTHRQRSTQKTIIKSFCNFNHFIHRHDHLNNSQLMLDEYQFFCYGVSLGLQMCMEDFQSGLGHPHDIHQQ